MIYFVTGASGFIGKRLVRSLLRRPGSTVYFLMRDPSAERVAKLQNYWQADRASAVPLAGDVTRPDLGLGGDALRPLEGRVDHVFHLAALYHLEADAAAVTAINVGGTREAVRFAAAIGARHFHHVSSIAVAGFYKGVFREDMFDEAEHLDHPYFASKHEAERIVRCECAIPWRIYRPGIVVGDSRTGEMDKIDGPYYFFKLIQQMRRILPPWMPAVGIEGGRINLVPVDFVVSALDYLAHLEGVDGRCFHLTDPHPRRVGEVLNIFAAAGHAPMMSLRVNAALFGLIPRSLARSLMALTPVRRIRELVMQDLHLPEGILEFVNCPTRFDSREADRLLGPAGISVPPLEDYAWRLWDYWERHLDPDLSVDRSLHGQVFGRVILISGGSSGIGKSAALKLAKAGAIVLIVARDRRKLENTGAEAAALGLRIATYAADITEPEQCDSTISRVIAEHGGVDILVNNAGRSIRREIESSFDRFHDFERMMAVNYFGALRLTFGFLPGMAERRRGHVINISSIGVLTDAPRFSAYIASKAALEAWARCAASEFLDRGVSFTTINMPLVRTPMIAPTPLYDSMPTLTPDEAAEFIVDAVVRKPPRIATRLGTFGQLLNGAAPRLAHIIMNTAFRMFPDSPTARGEKAGSAPPNADQVVFGKMLRGIHV